MNQVVIDNNFLICDAKCVVEYVHTPMHGGLHIIKY